MTAKVTTSLYTTNLIVGYQSGSRQNILFKDLNLTLHPGRLVCFMGPNGIGKSSLIRTLAGLQKKLGGEIHLPAAQIHDHAREIAVVLTDRVTAANMSVYDVISFGRYPYLNWNITLSPTDRRVIDNAIRMVNLDHLRNEKIFSLSDGQMQMVMIARALAQETPIILLDEPTAHLDLNNRVEIMRILKQLVSETNKSILLATHDLDLALQMADEVLLAGANKNIISGIPEDLVLNGTFDAIFQFKGFDLKTGKVRHEVTKPLVINLNGEGYEYLWTKNALERNGFEVVREGGAVTITLYREGESLNWKIVKAAHEEVARSVHDLIHSL